MKRPVISMALILSGIISGAQTNIFLETFDTELPSSWTVLDLDGNTAASSANEPWEEWAYFDGTEGENYVRTHAWYFPMGTSDDWLISPAISIPASGNLFLRYDMEVWGSAMSYEVRMSIGSGSTAPADFTFIIDVDAAFDESEWTEKMFPLPPAAFGNDIHIAFRENSTLSTFLNLDNVAIVELEDDDISMVSVQHEDFVEAGSYTISGTVMNVGINPITSFDVNWNDGIDHNVTFPASIPSWATAEFTHTIPLNATAGTYYDIDVIATCPGDVNANNDTLYTWMSTVITKPQKFVVGEERTGTWCGWCPRGTVAMANMESITNFIGIAVHCDQSSDITDTMSHSVYSVAIQPYTQFGVPGCGVDRVIKCDPDDLAATHAIREPEVAPAAIEVSASVVDETDIEVEVSADFFAKIDGDYRLACVITESNISGTESAFDQVNYYSFESNNLPLVGAGHDWQAEPDPVPAADMQYDHVAVRLGDNELNGASGSLPTLMNIGETASYTYSFTAGTMNLDNCRFIGMIIDNQTDEILNAGYTDTYTSYYTNIEEYKPFRVSIFPNPSSDITHIEISLDHPADVSVQLFNSTGQEVLSNGPKSLSEGVHNLAIDVSQLPAGIYLIRTAVEGKTDFSKLSVR